VTVVLLLSEPDVDFSGGSFECKVGVDGKKIKLKLKAGDAIGFPARHLEHRVNKTITGLRRSIVFWATRPGKPPLGRFGENKDEDQQTGPSKNKQPPAGASAHGEKTKRRKTV
jgi:hypothetical protein